MKVKDASQPESDQIMKLRQLRKAVKDSVKRFRILVQISESDQLISFYKEKFNERRAFENQIVHLLKSFSVRSKSSGSVTGAFVKLHTNLQVILGKDPDQVSLTKATYHEESLLYEYEFALKQTDYLTDKTSEILEVHAQQIQADIQRLKAFDI